MIYEATYNDIDGIVKLEHDTLGESLGYNMIKSLIDNEINKVYILEDKGLAGYVSISFDGSVVEIYNICIAKDRQNQGLGKYLLGYIITLYSFKADTFFLEVRRSNTNAISLYKYFDFKEINVRKNYYKNEDALVFEKVITKYDDINSKIIDHISNKDTIDGIVRYYTLENPFSYQYNYYELNDNLIDNVAKIINNPDSRINKTVISYKGDGIDIEGFSKERTISMYASVPVIKEINKTDKKAKVLNDSDFDALGEYVYQIDLKYGSTYAELNKKYAIKKAKCGLEKYIACYKDEKIIGLGKFATVGNSIYFSDYEVMDNFQHQGYGTAIFNELINYAKSRNIIDIFLEADYDDTYKDMYHKMGFEYGNIYTEYVEDENRKN